MRLSLVLLGLAALAGCAPEKQLYVDDAWVRLPAVAGRPAAAYFTVHGGPTDSTLVAVTGNTAIRSEMHETRRAANGAMTMAPISAVPIPALKDVPFTPGGKHVMLFNVNPVVKPGGAMTLTFTFADATRIEYNAKVVAAGDPAPE